MQQIPLPTPNVSGVNVMSRDKYFGEKRLQIYIKITLGTSGLNSGKVFGLNGQKAGTWFLEQNEEENENNSCNLGMRVEGT